MATITSMGVGSGMDIKSLVSDLVAADRAPRENRIARQESKLTTEFSALGLLKSSMAGLQAAAKSLSGNNAMALNRTVVSDEQYFAASAAGSAVPGGYDVQVAQLASAARLGSGLYAEGPDATVGTGTLSIAVGTSTFDVEIAAGGDSLSAIRDAINTAEGNTKVRATLIRDAAGSYLVLTGTATGAANAISVTTSNADAGLQQLATDLNAFDATRDLQASDAVAYISGYEVRSPTNSISGAIDGVTLTFKKVTEPGQSLSLTVQQDDAGIQKKAEAFVASFNALVQQMKSLGRYDAVSGSAGPLLGDSLLRSIDTQLRRMVSEPVAGATGTHRTLSSLGIAMDIDGRLQLDATRFREALAADPDSVGRVFSAESGVATRVSGFLDQRLSATGEFATRDARITAERKRIGQDREALDARMQIIQERYLKQFTAMDSMLAQLQTTSSYLTQQLSALSGSNK